MAPSIFCPHCNGKLAIRDELAGKRVICPHCKTAFQAPAEAAAEESFADFFADLSAPATPRSPASGPPALTRAAPPPRKRPGPPPRPLAGTKIAKRGMKMNLPPTPYLLWGGAGLAVLILAIGGWALVSSYAPSLKYNLTQSQRKRLFYELVGAIDNLGYTNKACRTRWQELEDQFSVNNEATREILKEGFEHSWPQPNFEHVGQGLRESPRLDRRTHAHGRVCRQRRPAAARVNPEGPRDGIAVDSPPYFPPLFHRRGIAIPPQNGIVGHCSISTGRTAGVSPSLWG